VNRIDDMIVFDPLTQEQLRAIVSIQLRLVGRRLAGRGLDLEVTDAAENLLAARGFDPVYGARPLKRVIRQLIENPLAHSILAGEFAAGDTVHVDADPTATTLVFQSRQQAGAMATEEMSEDTE